MSEPLPLPSHVQIEFAAAAAGAANSICSLSRTVTQARSQRAGQHPAQDAFTTAIARRALRSPAGQSGLSVASQRCHPNRLKVRTGAWILETGFQR